MSFLLLTAIFFSFSGSLPGRLKGANTCYFLFLFYFLNPLDCNLYRENLNNKKMRKIGLESEPVELNSKRLKVLL